MAVLARGQITITDMRNEGSYTFVRYSDDGGKTFTAASQAALDEVQAGLPLEGRNLVSGMPSFDGWSVRNGIAAKENQANANWSRLQSPLADFSIIEGKTVTVSFKAKGAPEHFVVCAALADENPENDRRYWTEFDLRDKIAADAFTTLSLTFVADRTIFNRQNPNAPDINTLNKLRLMFFRYTTEPVYIKEVKLEVGDKASMFTPTNLVGIKDAEKNTWAGRNLKQNSNFKYGISTLKESEYQSNGYTSATKIDTGLPEGLSCGIEVVQPLSLRGFFSRSQNGFYLLDGKTYTMSFYYKSKKSTRAGLEHVMTRDFPASEVWRRHEMQFVPADGWRTFIFYGLDAGTFSYTGIKIELGDTATPWTPAPEDCTFGTTTGKYMGIAVWDKPYPPLDPSDYTWSEVQGRGVASIVRYFGLSNSDAVEPKTYDTSPKSPTPTARYLWGYDLVTYTDGTAVQMPHQVIAVHGNKGKDGTDGTDAVNIIPDPAQIIVDTNDKGLVTNTELKGAKSVIRAYRGGTQVTCSAIVKSTSKGIGVTAMTITEGVITTPQILINSIDKDPNTGYAYASGYVDLDVVVDKKTYKTRLTVGTNIHKVTAKLVKKTDEIGLEVSGVRKDFKAYEVNTNSRISVAEGKIANTVSKDTFGENNERISTEFRQTADSISLAVQNGTRPNLLWGSDLNLDGVDTTDKGAIEKHLGVGLSNNLKTDDAHFSYLHGQGIDGSDAMYFKNDPAAGVEFPGLFWEKVNGAVRNLKLKRNTKYTVSAWIKFAPPQDGQLGVYNCEAFATNSETDAERVARYDVEGQYQSDSVSEWKRVVFKFTTGEYDYAAVTILTSGEGICELWICRPKLEEGDTGTPWCEYDGTEEGLRRTGIDIKTGEITLDAKNTIVKENLTTKRLLTNPTYAGGPYAEIYGSEFLIWYGDRKKGAQFGIGDDGLLHLIFFDANGKAVGDLGPGGWSKLIDATTEAKWTDIKLKNITGEKNINVVRDVMDKTTPTYYRFTAARNSELGVAGENAEYDKQLFIRYNDFSEKIQDGWYISPNNGKYKQWYIPYEPLVGEEPLRVYFTRCYHYLSGKQQSTVNVYYTEDRGILWQTDRNGEPLPYGKIIYEK